MACGEWRRVSLMTTTMRHSGGGTDSGMQSSRVTNTHVQLVHNTLLQIEVCESLVELARVDRRTA